MGCEPGDQLHGLRALELARHASNRPHRHRSHQTHHDVVRSRSQRIGDCRRHLDRCSWRFGRDRACGIGQHLADVGHVGRAHADRHQLDLLAERLEHPPVGVPHDAGAGRRRRRATRCARGDDGEAVTRRGWLDGLDRVVAAGEQRDGGLPHLATGAAGAEVERRPLVPDGRTDQRRCCVHRRVDRRRARVRSDGRRGIRRRARPPRDARLRSRARWRGRTRSHARCRRLGRRRPRPWSAPRLRGRSGRRGRRCRCRRSRARDTVDRPDGRRRSTVRSEPLPAASTSRRYRSTERRAPHRR